MLRPKWRPFAAQTPRRVPALARPARERRQTPRWNDPSRPVTRLLEHVPDESKSAHFRELARKSHEARRAKKEAAKDSTGDKLQAAMRRYIEDDPDAAVQALMRTARGTDAILAYGAGLFPEQRSKEEARIVVVNPFRASPRHTLAHWLQLLRRGDYRQLEAEFEAHSQEDA
jgi:hypothetical protein